MNGTFEINDETGLIELHVTVDKRMNKHGVEELKDKLVNYNYRVVQHNRLTMQQLKTIWLICTDYSMITGYDKTEIKDMMLSEFCARNDIPEFSISPMKKNACSVSTAAEFIQFILEHALANGIYLVIADRDKDDSYKFDGRNIPEIYRHVMSCFLQRKCAVCGAYADPHHEPSISSVGATYKTDTGMLTGFMPLCREHHNLRHNIGYKAFIELYHLQEIKLTENLLIYLCSEDIYPNQFQKFREDHKETIKQAKELLKGDLIR